MPGLVQTHLPGFDVAALHERCRVRVAVFDCANQEQSKALYRLLVRHALLMECVRAGLCDQVLFESQGHTLERCLLRTAGVLESRYLSNNLSLLYSTEALAHA